MEKLISKKKNEIKKFFVILFFVILPFFAFSQVKLLNHEATKIYPDNTRITYMELSDYPVDAEFLQFVEKEVLTNTLIQRFSLSKNGGTCFFHSHKDITEEMIVEAINEAYYLYFTTETYKTKKENHSKVFNQNNPDKLISKEDFDKFTEKERAGIPISKDEYEEAVARKKNEKSNEKENNQKLISQANIKPVSALNQIKWEKGGIYEGFSPKDEILEKRTQNTKHFQKDNGNIVAQIGGNYHYQDENNLWQDIDFTITKTNANGFAYSNITNTVKTYFPESAGDKGIAISDKSMDIKIWKNPELLIYDANKNILHKESSLNNSAKVKDNIVQYQSFNGVIDEIKIIDNGIENNIIIDNLQDQWTSLSNAKIISFKQFVELSDGVKILNSKGNIITNDFSDEFIGLQFADGQILYLNPLVVFDAQGNKEDAQLFYGIEDKNKIPEEIKAKAKSFHKGIYTIKFVKNGIEIYSDVSLEWLQQAQYPVTVDPTWTVGSTASGSFYGPMTHWYGYQRHASLYRQSEINGYGTITQIEYYKTNDAAARTKPTKVFMRNITDATITSTNAWNSTTYTSGATACFNGNTTQDNTVGWKAIPLSTLHDYNTGNLLVMVYDAYGGSGSTKYMAQESATGLQTYKRADSSDPGDGSTMTVDTYRASIRITYSTNSSPCTPTFGSGTNYWITNFTTTGGTSNINNSTTGTGGAYNNYFNSHTHTANAGSTVSFSVTFNNSSSSYGLAIWVDWNNNNVFEASERVFATSTYVTGPTLTGSFTIPASQANGAYRMRVNGDWLTSSPNDPCYVNYGEIEDYKIVVGTSPCLSIQTMECGQTYNATLQPNSGYWTNYTGNTLSWNGSEQVWSFTAPTTGSYTFNVNQGTNDADFFLMASCSNTGTNLSSGYWTGIGGTSHTVTLSAGVTYYLIADLYSSNSSTTVTVSVDCPSSATEMIVPASGNNSYTTCSGHLYDNGGASGNYASSSNGYTVLYPGVAGQVVRVSGTITCEGGYDYLTIYNGVGTGGTILWGGSSHGSGTSCSTFTVPAITSTTGPLTVKFYSDGSNNCAGFDLTVSCVVSAGTGADCASSIAFCTEDNYLFPASTNVTGYGQVGCLYSTPNPAWYYMQVGNPGDIIISISSGYDVDFIAWGPYTSVDTYCSEITMGPCTPTSCPNNTSNPSFYPYGDIVDCSYSAASSETVHILGAQTGQVYALLITNYSNQVTNISFQQSSGSGTADCSIVAPPISSNSVVCVGNTLELYVTYSQPGATYQWTGPNGWTSNQMNPTRPNATTAMSGTYSMVVTIGGLTSDPVTTQVTVAPNVTPTFNAVGPYCQGASIPALPTTSTNGISGTWSPAINNTSTTEYTFTPNAGLCATISTLTIAITPNVTPTFDAVGPYCSGAIIPALPTTSNNGISGTWSPAINNTSTTEYTFTPNAGLCATISTLTIAITPNVTPTFDAVGPYCSGAIIPALPTTSNNGIIGTWSPAINNTSTTEYTFTPNAGLCATISTLTIAITPNVTPTFDAVGPYCSGAIIPALPTTSNNGIIGTWSPAINNTSTTEYTFTPNAGLCATTSTLTIAITPNVTPTFDAVGPYCSGAIIPALPTTSNNGIIGTWSPAINNTSTTEYTFTPNAGLCATISTLTIAITPNVTPTFDAVGPYCSGAIIPALPTTSNNGIIGTWSPAINNTSTTEYTFTPNAGLCATTSTLTIAITPNVTPTFDAVGPYCSGAIIPALPTTSNNGIIGTWSPAINNTSTTEYTFTPNAGLCATTSTMQIVVNNCSIATPCPDYSNTVTSASEYCAGQTYYFEVLNTACDGELFFDVVGNYGSLYASEITWEVTSNATSNVVASGGPGTNGAAIFTVAGPIDTGVEGTIFTLTVYDSFGNGFNGTGGTIVIQQSGVNLVSPITGDFGDQAHTMFMPSISISPATITVTTPAGDVTHNVSNCGDFFVPITINNTNFCTTTTVNLPWVIRCDSDNSLLASGTHSLTIYPNTPDNFSDIVTYSFNAANCEWVPSWQNDCNATHLGSVFDITPDPTAPVDACVANNPQTLTLQYNGITGSPDCCSTAGPSAPITYNYSLGNSDAVVASSPFGGVNNSAYFTVPANGSGGAATALSFDFDLSGYCFEQPNPTGFTTFWVTVLVNGMIVHDGQFVDPATTASISLDLTDIPSYDQNSVIEVYVYPNSFSYGGVNTTFVPGVTCPSLTTDGGQWTATFFGVDVSATFTQEAPTPITCTFTTNVVQPCCATTAVANVAQTICSGDAFGLATWQTNVESVNPTCIVYSSVTPIAGSVLPNNNMPNGTNGTGSPIVQTVSAYAYCDSNGSGTFNAGDTYTLLSTFTLTINPIVTPTFDAVGPYCSGAIIPALPTTSNNGISGTWSPAINNTSTTEYTFTPNAGLCATISTLTIAITPNVTPTFDAVGPYCSGAIIPALPTTSNNGISGAWSPAINNTSTTEYTFTPNAGLCATISTLTIAITPNVTPTFDAVGPYCSGAIIPALPTTSNNGISGTWSPAINNTSTTEYTFTPNAGLCVTISTLTIVITQPDAINISSQISHPTCHDFTNGEIILTVSGGSPSYTYEWNPAGTGGSGVQNLTGVGAGTYNVTVTDANLCVSSASYTLTEPSMLSISETVVNTTCDLPNGSVGIIVSGGTPQYTYQWDAAAQNATTPAVTNLTNQEYSVTVTDANQCIIIDTISVGHDVPPVLSLVEQINETCSDINGQITVEANEGKPNYIYSWAGYPGHNNPDINDISAGNYIAIVTDGDGCVDSLTIVITNHEPPEVGIASIIPAHCDQSDAEISLEVIGGSGNYTYDWGTIPPRTSIHETDLPSGQYTVTVSDGVCDIEMIVDVPNLPGPSVNASANPNEVYVSKELVRFNDGSIGATSWYWDYGTGEYSHEQTPSYKYEMPGTYDVVLMVTDNYGCSASDTVNVIVHEGLEVWIPNAFTPDSDGLNELFGPIAIGMSLEGYEMEIYDRWGKQAFYTKDYYHHWDGTINGSKVTMNSVFVYRIVIYDKMGKDYIYTGRVSLIFGLE